MNERMKPLMDEQFTEFCAQLNEMLDIEEDLPPVKKGEKARVTYGDVTTKKERTWKDSGSDHYKTGDVEPIDLYHAGDMLRDFALCNIIKYAFRNRRSNATSLNPKDLEKIIHYAIILQKLG